jgi:hypothetical protein
MEAIVVLLVLVVGLSVAIWFVRTYHRPRVLGQRLGGSSFPPGTRAFEAEMSLGGIIAKMIEGRERELLGPVDGAKRADLERQIANLRAQATIHRATVEARDLSKGKMSIGANPDSDTVG